MNSIIRVILYLVVTIAFVSCKSKKIDSKPKLTQFEIGAKNINANISKIDSVSNYYFVFIENDQEFYKIISNKNQAKPQNGIKIKVGENYQFKIQQLTDRKPSGSNDKFIPVNYLDITRCIDFNGTEICTEASFELAKPYNLNGLYIFN